MEKVFFTSESVTEGHPDKICDQISDAVLDAVLQADPNSRVAIETFVKTGFVLVGGELTTKAEYIDVQKIARDTLIDIGYDNGEVGFNGHNCGVLESISEQSHDISVGVNSHGAGDQGMMFGYACDETEELMPLPISLAHRLTKRLAEVRKNGILDYLYPDGKAQVTVEYNDDIPARIEAIVVSNHHKKEVSQVIIKADIEKHVIRPVCGDLMDADTHIHINPTGAFTEGGPVADAGLTGRKIIVAPSLISSFATFKEFSLATNISAVLPSSSLALTSAPSLIASIISETRSFLTASIRIVLALAITLDKKIIIKKPAPKFTILLLISTSRLSIKLYFSLLLLYNI